MTRSASIHACNADVVIIGGAMAGATLALAINKLTNGELTIALIEAKPISHEHQGFDARSIALSYGSCGLLDNLGLWQPLSAFATAIQTIHVSDSGHLGMLKFDAAKQRVPFLGQVVELADAGQVLYQKLAQANNIKVYCPAQVTKIDRQQSHSIVTLTDHSQITTKLVVAADGGQSTSCDMLGIARVEHDFGQTAIIANVTTDKPHQFHAYERFTQHGPVALLPMSKGRCSLVWCTTPAQAKTILAMDKPAFLANLQQAFGWRLGAFKQSSLPYSYPLILRQASRLISHRAAVVGNAAQTLHPIAGQGFNLGLRDVMTLANQISHAHQTGVDIGSMRTLQAYRAKREQDRDSTVRLIASLVYGFSTQSLPIAASRNLGLVAMSASETLSMPLLQHMMGLNRSKTAL